MRSSIRRPDEHRSTPRALLFAAIGAAVSRAAGAHELPVAPNVSGFELPQPMALQPFALRTVDRTRPLPEVKIVRAPAPTEQPVTTGAIKKVRIEPTKDAHPQKRAAS